ncbi:MAG: ferritin-like domain-containing protein [Planctomycetaceae bacterium]
MELRAFAEQVLLSDSLSVKLQAPVLPLTVQDPGPAILIDTPGRPAALLFAPRRTAPAMPHGSALHDPAKRAVAHHIMANHELQALEVMGMILLSFPQAPADFRSGLAEVMVDEQRHTRMHMSRCRDLGTEFGDFPVNSWIWQKAQTFRSELEYVAGLPLVFEGANLDHSIEFEEAFLQAGDRRSAAVMRTIHNDEIRHVRFGMEWLQRFKPPGQSDWDAWTQALHFPLRPSRARGTMFQHQARLEAGLSEEFIQLLREYSDDTDQPREQTRG